MRGSASYAIVMNRLRERGWEAVSDESHDGRSGGVAAAANRRHEAASSRDAATPSS